MFTMACDSCKKFLYKDEHFYDVYLSRRKRIPKYPDKIINEIPLHICLVCIGKIIKDAEILDKLRLSSGRNDET